jgi:hypothetical protein
MQSFGPQSEMHQVLREAVASLLCDSGFSSSELRDVLAGLTPEQRLAGLSPEQILQGLAPEERAQLRKMLRASDDTAGGTEPK